MPVRQRLIGVAIVAALTLVLFDALAFNVAAITRSQARTVAQAVNLAANDVPGFKASSVSPHVPSQTGRCPGEVPPRHWLAFAHSDAFEQGTGNSFLEIDSAAAVLPTAQLAKRDLAALNGTRGRQCFAGAVRRSLAGSGFKLLQLSTATRPAPAPGGVGLRLVLRVSNAGTLSTVYADALLFVRKQLSVALDAASIGRPFPPALERRLSQVLVARAKRYVP